MAAPYWEIIRGTLVATFARPTGGTIAKTTKRIASAVTAARGVRFAELVARSRSKIVRCTSLAEPSRPIEFARASTIPAVAILGPLPTAAASLWQAAVGAAPASVAIARPVLADAVHTRCAGAEARADAGRAVAITALAAFPIFQSPPLRAFARPID